MVVVERMLSELIPADYNPRKISEKDFRQLKNSLSRFAAVEPAVVNMSAERRNVLVGGHQRVKAAQALGWETFPCVEVMLAEPEERELNVRLNRNTGEWDFEALMKNFAASDLVEFGFDLAELQEPEPVKGATDPDAVPEPPKVSVTKPGQVWSLGAHRLMCGDSTKAADVERLMGGTLADLLLTDPPYNVAYTGGTSAALTIANDSMEDAQFRQFLTDAMAAAAAVMRPGAAFYVWHADSEGLNFRAAIQAVDLELKQNLIWVKSSMVLGRQDYQWRHEPCLYGWKPGAAHTWNSDRKQTTVLEFDKPARNGEHPTMKPVDLFAYQVGNSSAPGGVVLDLFGGSGTTAIACEQLGRKACLMELDPIYCDVIVKRWEEFSGAKAVLL